MDGTLQVIKSESGPGYWEQMLPRHQNSCHRLLVFGKLQNQTQVDIVQLNDITLLFECDFLIV